MPLPTLRADLLLLHAPAVFEFRRRRDVIVDDGAVPVSFGSVSLMMALDEIYEGVVFPTAEERLRLREEEAIYG